MTARAGPAFSVGPPRRSLAMHVLRDPATTVDEVAADTYRPRLALTVLGPAAAVLLLCIVGRGLLLVVWLLALVGGLGSLGLPGRGRFIGGGLLLGCLAVLLAVTANYE